jgi:hypothetical protein
MLAFGSANVEDAKSESTLAREAIMVEYNEK